VSLFVGFAAYFAIKLCEEPERAERLAALCLDPRWPWQLMSVTFGVRDKVAVSTRRQKLVAKDGIEKLRDGIMHPKNRHAEIVHRANAEDNHAHLHVQTGQQLAVPSWSNPAELTGLVKGPDLPAGAELAPWLEVMHQIMLTLEVGNAILSVWPTERMAHGDGTLSSTVLDTPSAVYNLGVDETFELQNDRAIRARRQLGDKYIRHPRWGTYLRRAHLDRCGGLQRIRDTVPLAKVLELGGAGDLVYLQCTEHPSGALTREGEQVRQALQDALAPIVAPPRPQEANQAEPPRTS
jgi:hypothetical protein